MQSMTIKEVVYATKGILINSIDKENIQGVSTDTRSLKTGDLYIPIKGEKFDGHDFIEQAIQKGASAYLTENKNYIYNDANMILVEDTLSALHNLARYYKEKFDIPFIAITGSSGKTTTKDMVASVLEQKYNVLKTQGNFNNEIGLPLTLFQLEDIHEIAVIEMGMSNLGEISTLVNIVCPDIAVITNIGLTHIENLGSQEKIFHAKKEILETLKEEQLALLNGDDAYLKTVFNENYQTAFIGMSETNLALKAKDIFNQENSISFTLEDEDKNVEKFILNLPGIHNVYNSLFAIYIGKKFGMNSGEIQRGLNNFKPSKMRMDISEVGQIKIIDDVYNANPDSMKATLRVLRDSGEKRRKIAILGDMLEMGKWAKDAHYNIGKFSSELNIDLLLAIGEYAECYIQGAIDGEMPQEKAIAFQTNSQAIEYLKSEVKNGDIFLVKGSRGIKMEEVVMFLQERGKKCNN